MPATTFHTLTASSVLSRLDYGNAVLAFLSTCPADSSQYSTRLLYGLRHSDHIFDGLITLHWLRAQERVRFKTAVLVYKSTRGTASLRRHTWVNWFVSPICLVSAPSAVLGPIVCWYRPWNCLPSAPGLPVRRTYHLEQPAEQRVDVMSVPSALENISPVDPEVIVLLAWTTLEIHDWLIDWNDCRDMAI